MPLTSFLRASWAPAGAVSVSALRTIEKTAIRRYRMITSPNDYKLAIPVFRSRPHLRPEVQREFRLSFVSPRRNQYTFATFFWRFCRPNLYTKHRGPVDLVLRQHPALLQRRGPPLLPRRQRLHGLHVGPRQRPDVDGIGDETRNDRRVHGVGCAKAAE